jgi:protein involved in polysaccharide export with SLBB domain
MHLKTLYAVRPSLAKQICIRFFYKKARLLAFILVSASALCTSPLALAQGMGGAQGGITAADLTALRGGAMGAGGGMGAPGLAGGGGGVTGHLAIPMPTANSEDEADAGKPDPKSSKKQAPLPPNEFQKYLLQITGQMLPLYGADFFESLNNNNAQYARSPVGDDYVLGAGDQLLIRIWGSTSAETTVSIDRQGAIAIPKLGTLRLAGVKAGQVDAVVKAFFSKFYKDIEVSVALGKLRKITVFAVGQSRNPGSYALSSQATLTTALFASGGPSGGGSIRRVQLKRQGQTVAEFDLYAFLGKGDKSADIKLQDGDVLFYPRAAGFMALLGKVNSPGVYEIKEGADSKANKETLADYLNLAGGLPVTADPRRATLERVQIGTDQPRRLQDITLAAEGLQTPIKNGDVLTVAAIVPELANAVTLRGAVAQPNRMAWRQGMRVSDVISKKSLLINPETVRKQNEVLFDNFEQERTARGRARVPSDLAVERMLLEKKNNADDQLQANQQGINVGKSLDGQVARGIDLSKASLAEQTDREISIAQLGKPVLAEENLADRIGKLNEEINLDYAVIERYSRDTLEVTLLPFHLGRVLANPSGKDDLALQPGDVITVFAYKDIQVPISRRQILVRIEGEVNSPGVYQLGSNKSLQQLIQMAGGTTTEAFPFATSLFREEVKKTQKLNMDKILRKMESESSSVLAQIMQSGGADSSSLQAKIQSVQLAQKQAIDRFKSLKPEGRIALDIPVSSSGQVNEFPATQLENGDRIVIPPKPSFVQVIGVVNTESALLYRKGATVKDYLAMSGVGSSADVNGAILVRINGNSITNQSTWRNDVLSAEVLPGDTIFLPEKLDRESVWSQSVRTAKDFTQVLYQLGLGAAAIKTLRQ